MSSKRGGDDEGEVVYSMYITRKGVRIYRPDGKPWRFVVRRKGV